MESQGIDLHYIEKWLPDASVNYKDGRPAVKLGLIITVFFKDGHLPEVRKKMVECVDRFYAENSQHLKKTIVNKRWTSITENNYNKKKQSILESSKEEIFSWYAGSAETDFTAPDYSILIMGKPIFHNDTDRSVIKICLPLSYIHNKTGLNAYQQWLMWLCNTFNVEVGYAGLSFILPYSRESMFPYEYSLAKRFSGTMVDSIGTLEGTGAVIGLKGPCWYTVIGNHWIEKLGGREAITQKLKHTPEITTLSYNSGIILKTGELPPAMGEINSEGLPPELVKINQIIRPIRFNKTRSLHFWSEYEDHQFTETSTMKWYRRFDSASDLLSEQEKTPSPEDTRITCNTGEPAPHAGHWATIKNGLLRDIHVSEGQRMPPFKDRKEQAFNVTWSLLEREDKGSVFK